MGTWNPVVKFKRLHPGAELPSYATDGAAGMDLRAFSGGTLYPNQSAFVATGVAIQLPSGYEAQVRSRSGLAAKHRVVVLNAPGTIDSDYRGDIGVLLINHGSYQFEWRAGDRLAQLVIAPVARAVHLEVDELGDTVRGAGGFGSTGVR